MSEFNFWAYLTVLAMGMSSIYMPKKEYSDNIKIQVFFIHLFLMIMLVADR